MKVVETTAKTIEEAIDIALVELNASREEVEIKVINRGKTGLLGFGNEQAKVKVEKVGGQFDGELVYIAYDWQHPPILELDPPLSLYKGEGFKLIATYNNWTDDTLHFGLLSEDEMMILFGYYYLGSPKVSIEDEPLLPVAFDLKQNYPNPFNAETKVEFTLNRNSDVKLYLYDMIGRPVRTLLDLSLIHI